MLLCGARDFPFAFAYLCLSVLLRICNKKHREKSNKVVKGKNIYMLTFPLLLLLALKLFSVKISCGNKTSFLTVYIYIYKTCMIQNCFIDILSFLKMKNSAKLQHCSHMTFYKMIEKRRPLSQLVTQLSTVGWSVEDSEKVQSY